MSESSKRTRCNDRQKYYLVDYMFAKCDHALGTLTSPMGVAQQDNEWAKLADELANFGPRKYKDFTALTMDVQDEDM